MKTETLKSCVRYFEKVIMNEVKQAHTYDKIELSDYAKELIDKKEESMRFELTSHAKALLNKDGKNNFV